MANKGNIGNTVKKSIGGKVIVKYSKGRQNKPVSRTKLLVLKAGLTKGMIA